MRTVSVHYARANLSDVLGSVYYGKEPVMVAKKGKPVAVVMSPEVYDQLREQQDRQRAADWAVIDQIGERNRDKDPDAELAFITEVVDDVRRERHAKARREQTADRR
jgi:prevent-host-death family protein